MGAIRDRNRSYIVNLLLAIDQLFSALFGYNADVSISAALGEVQWTKYDGDNIAYVRPLQAYLQRALDKTQEHHCLKAYMYEMEKRKEAVVVIQIRKVLGMGEKNVFS